MVEYSDNIKACLITGAPIYVGNVPIYSVSFRQISESPMSLYFSVIGILSLSQSEIKRRFGEKQNVENSIDVLRIMYITNKQLFNQYNNVLSYIFGEPIKEFTEDGAAVFESGFTISKDNLFDIVTVIRMRNGMYSENGDDEFSENPANDNVKQLLERRKILRQKVASLKKQEDSDIGYTDYFSIYASISGLSLQQVSEYDLYQISNQLKRYQMHEQFDIQLQSMMHGAKIEDDEFKNYMRQIDTRSDNE